MKPIPDPKGSAKIGQKVYVPSLNLVGEVQAISDKVKNLITHIKIAREDGEFDIKEVQDLVVEAIVIVRDVIFSDIWKVIGAWVKGIFKRKK
jgi:hypothetical protein